nr:MAG TPA: hypothetical protein [Caudoviricetes sp.]
MMVYNYYILAWYTMKVYLSGIRSICKTYIKTVYNNRIRKQYRLTRTYTIKI